MSIKDLFGRKTVVVKNAESASIDAESNRFVLRKAEQNETYVPPVDFATASNFVRFGSAEEYYEASVRRVYSEYPYDGSAADKILYSLSSSYFDRYILEQRYPSSTGYGILSPTGYGAGSKVNGYGLNASSSDYEYIWIGGGVRPAPQNQNDPSSDDTNIPLYKKFKYGTFYEEGTDKTTVFSFSAVSGSTFEFWLKKKSFDTTNTEKEVILDLWNGVATSSAQYGRITIELDATNEGGAGANPLRLTYQNGTVGVYRQSLASGSFTTSDIADDKWHHWAISTMPRIDNSTTTNYLDLKLYKDGVVINQQSIVTTSSAGTPQTIGNIVGRLDGYMGALIAPVWDGKSGSTTGAKYAGKLSASLDEFRFWKKRINSHEIYNNWYHPIGGGANTDKYREHLALYYKFNEGITTTSSIDSVVLDYSGRVANGSWTGYSVNSRNTGSCFVSASVLAHEPLDPIIRSNHQSVKDLISELQISGSQYDLNNSAYMYDMVPFWMREEDFDIGDNNLKKMYQIIASYFDTLYLQIESLPDLKTKQYFSMDKKPYPFSKQLLEHNGLIVPDLFVSQGVLEKFSQRDDQNKKFEYDMDDLKKRIYYNIYNNLKTIYESKGTEKSYRNLLRCFGIDDEIVKLNLYTDYGIQYLTDKVKYSSQKTKFINHNISANFTGRVFNTSSVGNPRTFISGSGPLLNREEFLAFTLETDVIVPTKLKVGDLNYFPTDFLTSSIMGFHQADPSDPANFAWHGADDANLQVHLVRPINESEDAKFVITNNAKTIFAESETFKGIYNNERWALGLKVYPVGYPFVGHVANSASPKYVAELYGVSHNLSEVQREFTITASMTHAEGSAILVNAKRFYAGCEATNFTGTPHQYSDLKIGACRLWYDKLDNAVLKQHNLDASNYGHNKIHGNPTPYVDGLKDVHIPSAEALAFNWDFQQLTASDSNGRFVVEDFSSGTSADRYGWIDDLILRENRGGGFGYEASSKKVVDNEFIFSAKKELPEISFTSDGVFIKGDEETYFSEDEDTTDNVFAFEKSMYQVVSEEILKTFSTVTEYANLFMKPVDHYREEYKRLDHFKELYFERVENDMDFERFTNYFKFIDASVSIFIQQLHPAMAKFNEGISDMVESHILERPKYKRQFPLIVTRDNIPDGKMAGVKERKYPWREGHAPDYRTKGDMARGIDENDHCFWQKERRAIKPSGSVLIDTLPVNLKLDELRKVIVSETDGKAKNLGTTPPYSSYTITFGDGSGGGGMPAAGESLTIAFPTVSLLVSFPSGDGNAPETAFGQSTANELKIDVGDDVDWSALGFASAAERVASIIRTALINYTGVGLGADVLNLGSIPDLTSNGADRTLVLTAKTHGHFGLTFSDDAANIIITNISNTPRPTIYQGSTYAVRSFSRQYDFTYAEQKVIHGGTNYGHQKNRDFVLDHLKPHGGIAGMGIPQEVITVGVGEGLGILGLDKCKRFTDPYQTDEYTARHLEKAEYRFVGTVGRYADGTGDQPKSDEMDQLFKVKGHSSFPFNLVSGTIATGYNKKIHDKYDDDFILTNLHSDTTTPSNDVPMQGPFAEAWVGGRQFRHIPMNRYNKDLKSVSTNTAQIGPRRSLSWASTSLEAVYGTATLDPALDLIGTKSTCQIVYSAGITASDKLTLTHPVKGDYEITFAAGPGTGTETTFRTVDGKQKANIDINVANNAASQSNAVAVLLNAIPNYAASANGVDTVTLTATAVGPYWNISLAGVISGVGQAIGTVTAGDDALTQRGSFSITFWAKIPNNVSEIQAILQLDPDSLTPNTYGLQLYIVEDDLYLGVSSTTDGTGGRRVWKWSGVIDNNEWMHWSISINSAENIDDGTGNFLSVYKNNGTRLTPSEFNDQAGFPDGVANPKLRSPLKTIRIGDLGNSTYDGSHLFEFRGGSLQDLALWNKALSSADRARLYNADAGGNGRSIWPNIAPSGSAVVNWWTLGEEKAIKSLPIGSTIPARLDTEFRSVLGQKSRLHFPTSSVISIQQGRDGYLHNTKNYLDDQFTRPEAFRILAGDHPSEPVKDGALGMVGPDYGGPYPDTTRQMAVHYREERAKRPFNIKNIQYGTASAILGNFKENYEVVHSVGRSTNNRKLVEFASVSSSLTSPIGLILPQTTNQASLFGSTPLLSGNVFLAGDSNTSNRTLDIARVERYHQTAVLASGSMLFKDNVHYYEGSFASASLHVSGATLYSRATGSFTMSGSHVSGSHSQGSFRLEYPTFTVSEGDFIFTGSFIHGAEASGSITPAAPPALPKSTGNIQIANATTFGTPAVGSFKVGNLPTLSTSQGSFDIANAFVAATTAENGIFTVGSKTTYETQYTGSFKLQGPPVAGKRGYASFKVKGTTMTDGHSMTINLGGTSKQIVANTTSGSSGGDITLEAKNSSANTIKTLRSDANGSSILRDTSFAGLGTSDFTVSFWHKPYDANSDEINSFSRVVLGTLASPRYEHRLDLDRDVQITVENTAGSSSSKTFDTNWTNTTDWVHVTAVFPVNNLSTCDPLLYINGQPFTTTTGAAYSAPGGTSPTLGDLDIVIDDGVYNTSAGDGPGLHDFVIWNKALSSAEILEAYASGYYYDVSTHSAQGNIVSWWKLGREADFNSFNDGDEISGVVNLASSHGTTANVLEFYHEDEFRIENHRWDNHTGNKTNTQIFDNLKTDLATAYSDWDLTYRDIGGNEAEFYAHKKVIGSSGAAASLSTTVAHDTFLEIAAGSGIDAIASNLKHGDNITIEGDQFDVFTTTLDSSPTYVNAANSIRKALRFRSIGSDIENHAYNLSYANPTHATKLSVSWWMKLANIDATVTERIWEFDNGSINNSWAGIMGAGFVVYLYDDTGFQSRAVAYKSSNFSASDVGVWKHYTLVWSRTNADNETPILYINGVNSALSVHVAGDGWANTNPVPITKVYIGDNDATGQVQQNAGLQDFVIWDTELSQYDAKVLYNSGSWMNLYAHNQASKIWDWWMLGNESNIAQASGSALSTGTAVTSIEPTIGLHTLQFNRNADVIVTDGTADTWKADGTIFAELKTSIAANTLYQEAAVGVSTINFTTSGNTGTFTLTDSLPSAPTAFSNNANQGFHTLSGPTANGDDTNAPTGGATDGHYVQVDSVRFYVDSDNSHAGGNYAESGGHYYVYSNAADDATWWARFAAAVNAGVTTHTTTHTGGGAFDVDADTPGDAGNINITRSGTTFNGGLDNVDGGADANNDGNGRGVVFTSASGSAANVARNVYVYKDLSTKVGASHASDDTGNCTFIQDGVWLHTNGTNRHYFVSSTGSSPGSSGVSAALWQRVTASLAHGINTQTGAPAVTSSPNSSFNITPIAGGARITFTGTYTATNGHDFTLSSDSQGDGLGGGSSGDTVFSNFNNISGFGEPTDAQYKTQDIFVIDGTTFEFGYPYNGAAVGGGNIALEPAGKSKSELLTHMRDVLEANVPNFDFSIGSGVDADRICMTGSITGSVLHNKITDNAHQLVDFVTQTAGGTLETGAGHGRGVYLSLTPQARFYSIQTLASASTLNPNAQVIAPGIMWDNSNGSIKEYFISSTGETTEGVNVKSNGVNDDYWGRWRDALAHAVGSVTGLTGSWTRSGGSSTINFEGAFETLSTHSFSFEILPGTGGDAIDTSAVGPLFGGAEAVSNYTNVQGFGYPGSNYINSDGNLMIVDGVTFENVYPYNGYVSIESSATPGGQLIRHTGSQADYLSRLQTAMSNNLPNFTNFAVSSPSITFNATVTGSHRNQTISENFFGASTTNIAGGFAHEGVGSGGATVFSFSNAGGQRQLHVSDDLRNHPLKGSWAFTGQDGIWRSGGSTAFYLSTTGSSPGSNLTQAEWVRRVHNAFHLIVSGSGLSPVPNYRINIFSGSSENNYQHQFNITGSLTASNADMLYFGNLIAQNSDRPLRGGSDAVDGFGRLYLEGGVGIAPFSIFGDATKLTFANDDSGVKTFRFTIPNDSYAKDAGEIEIRTTGSVTTFFNRVSSSLKDNLVNYTITNVEDMGSNIRKFSIRANNTGSIYNADIGHQGPLAHPSPGTLSGGHLQYNAFDEDWILLANSGSGNHLFKLDHDGNQPVITIGSTHDFAVTVSASHGKFALNGELAPGSSYVDNTTSDGYGKQQADLILVRGRTYRFKQEHDTNHPGGTITAHHPIVLHNKPVTGSGAGTEIISLNRIPNVTYYNDGASTTYATYAGALDGNASDYVELSCSSTTPDRLFYGCGNHANMGGAIYVVDAANVHYTSTAGADAAAPTALRDSIAAALPRLTVAYDDTKAPDQAALSTIADDYLPEVKRYFISITGSTMVSSFDDTLIVTSGSSWRNVHQVTGAMTYREGQMPGQALHMGWGRHPDTLSRAFHSIGIGGLFGEDPFNGTINNSPQKTRELITSVYTGSHTINMTADGVPLTDPYYLTSSALWTSISSSIMNTGQYTITSTTGSHHKKFLVFNIASKYRNTRFNHNEYSSSAAVLTPAGDYEENFLGHGLYTSSVDGFPRATGPTGSARMGGFDIESPMLGGVLPLATDASALASINYDTAIEFQTRDITGTGETIRIRGNVSGWRDRLGDPAKTIYWDFWGPTNDAAGRTQVRTNLSGAWNRLTSSNGVPYYQITSIPANNSAPYNNFYALTASSPGQEFNFVTPADLNPISSLLNGGRYQTHISGSKTPNPPGVGLTSPENFGSHWVTGGVTFLPTVSYSSRTNVNPREQALLEDGVRNKTIITSRFYGGGGPEVMTEAFLDVHAKEKSVYSSLPYRHLLIKNDSGESARFVHETDQYGETVIYAASASVSVTSHAGRREGLNTLHSRHTGRFGIDSRHGAADSSDYTSPVLRRTFDAGAQSFSDTGGGGYEASFHKVHRNTFVRPDASTALRHPSTAEFVVGLFSADIAESVTYPSSGQMSFSFWSRLDVDADPGVWKYVADATDNSDTFSFIVRFANNRLHVILVALDSIYRAWMTPEFTGLRGKWNNFCVVWNKDDVAQAPTVYLNATPYTTVAGTVAAGLIGPGSGTGAQKPIAGRIALTGNDQIRSDSELQGALQDVAFYNTGLTHAQVNELYDQQDLYSVSFVDNIIEWWPLRSPVPTGVSPIGVEIPKDTKIFPAIGATVFITPPNIRGVPGRGKQPRRDNFYIQNILPQSDYNYSWVETSLGSNYSVRSGKQNVFGYWPKDGILVRNIKKGATGTYYETQVTASNFDSAINFPTGSDIFGSFES